MVAGSSLARTKDFGSNSYQGVFCKNDWILGRPIMYKIDTIPEMTWEESNPGRPGDSRTNNPQDYGHMYTVGIIYHNYSTQLSRLFTKLLTNIILDMRGIEPWSPWRKQNWQSTGLWAHAYLRHYLLPIGRHNYPSKTFVMLVVFFHRICHRICHWIFFVINWPFTSN